MFCKHCGAKIDDNSEYCKYCGGVQDSDTFVDIPSRELGHAYHTPDPYADSEKTSENTSFDPFDSTDNTAIDPFSEDKTPNYTNPFDREIHDDLKDITNDQDVIDSCNQGYIMKDGKKIQPRYVERTSNIPPPPTSTVDPFDMTPPTTGMNNPSAHMRLHHEVISEQDRTLSILTLVMAFVFPIAGIFIGKRFFNNIAHIPNPDPYYVRIARIGMKISYIDTCIFAFGLLLCIFLPIILLVL